MINLGSFLAQINTFFWSQVQNFLGDTGTAAPSKYKGGTSPFCQPPDVSFGWEPAPKSDHFFLTTFLKQKQVLGSLIRHFFTI
jgi:hypothetical protein